MRSNFRFAACLLSLAVCFAATRAYADSVPGAPQSLSAVAGTGKVTLTFAPPTLAEGASAVTKYTVTTNPPGGVDAGANTTNTTRDITGLTNGIQYTFTVTATNAAGTGPGATITGLPRVANALIVVDTLLDNGVGCTLRKAVQNGNGLYPPNPGCATGGFESTITFSVNGVLRPATTINIDGAPITIQGNGWTQTVIDGGGTIRLFDNAATVPTTITWRKLTIRNGRNDDDAVPGRGGILYVAATTTANIEDCEIDDNEGPRSSAIHSDGTLTVVRTSFYGNTSGGFTGSAGAISSYGRTTISESTFAYNEGRLGGAIGHANSDASFTSKVLTITNSTFYGNRAQAGGGAIYIATNTNNSIQYSTIVNNTASEITPTHGGGIRNAGFGRLILGSTIVANNHAAFGDDCSTQSGGFILSGGHNILTSWAECDNAFPYDDLEADPMLGSFGEHGGPTETLNLLPGSPALNREPNCPAGIDQRGRVRPQHGACDSGAVEVSNPDAPTGVTATLFNGYARVTFMAPVFQGDAPLTGYTVTSIPPGGIDAQAGTLDLSHDVSGLTNGVDYTFVVVATSALGSSPPSAPSTGDHFPLPPTAPTNVTAVGGPNSALVSFSPAVSDAIAPITEYTVTSNPPALITDGPGSPILLQGLANGIAYTFTVTATNRGGTSPPSAPSNSVVPDSAPGAPFIYSAYAYRGEATVAFEAAPNTGSPITGYTVISNPTGPVDTNAGTTATTHVLMGLQAEVPYTFTVVATNAIGTGPASPASNATTWKPLPDAPVMFSAQASGLGQALVQYNPPGREGDYPVTGYTVYSDPPGGIDMHAGELSLGHIVTGLTGGTTYTFTVRATNSVGQGPASAPSSPVTILGVPGAPTNVTVTFGTAPFSVDVSFTPPTNNGGATVTGYRVTATPGAPDTNGTSVATTHTFVNVNPGVPYTFTARAINVAGQGAISAPSASITLSASPGRVTNLVAVAGDRQATVSFTPPANNGSGPVVKYRVVASPGGTFVDAASSPVVMPGLTNGNEYVFFVIPFGQFGTGTQGPPSNPVVPQAAAPHAAAPFDFDGNGRGDIVIRDSTTGVEYGWLMNGLSIAGGGYLLDAGSGWRVIKSADFNGDGKADLLIQHTDGSAYIRLMDGLNVIGGGYLLGAGSGYTVTHVGDFNGDGKADVLMRHTDGSIYVQIMDGLAATSGTFLQGAGSGWTVTHVADFNGDGQSDILMRHTDGSIYVQLMNGITAIDGTYLLGAGSDWRPTAVGDFNGDHKADILITHDNGGVYLWQMNGTMLVTGTYLLSPGSGWSIADTADLDGDGKSDILIEHTDGSLYAWMMDGLTVRAGGYLLGASTGWGLAYMRDLDGDGKADILIEHTDGSIYGWIMNGPAIVNGTYLMGAGPWSVSP